jgi:hypothetical protein
MALKEKPDMIIRDAGLPPGDRFAVQERLTEASLSAILAIVPAARRPQYRRDVVLKAEARGSCGVAGEDPCGCGTIRARERSVPKKGPCPRKILPPGACSIPL